jgi:ubiquinone/menaquinone biosynthesis C-methylase UbiE
MAAHPADPAQPRRGDARTAVVWEALRLRLEGRSPVRVLDVGGGTGGFAVRVAALGHHVTVVDPSPDALAILDRRSEETGVADRVVGVQGDLETVPGLVAEADVDVVLCHGVLEQVEDHAGAVRSLAGVLRPGGTLSLLVGQRHAAVVARAVAGHFRQALGLLQDASAETVHRFTVPEATRLVAAAGFADVVVHGVRVFSDLVPSSLVDLEPGAAAALAELEHAVSELPEYLTLATQIHLLATRR